MKTTDELREEIERDWNSPIQVLEYIERPEFKTSIVFYRVIYPGINYSAVRIKVYSENSGYDNQVDSSGDILEMMSR